MSSSTLKSLWMENREMNRQEIFDTVVRHLFMQGRPAREYELAMCCYRLLDGDVVLKCAVGCLIPDEDYRVEMESKVVAALLDPPEGGVKRFKLPDYFREHYLLLEKLQMAHDARANYGAGTGLFNLPMLYEELEVIAFEEELNANVLEECYAKAKEKPSI